MWSWELLDQDIIQVETLSSFWVSRECIGVVIFDRLDTNIITIAYFTLTVCGTSCDETCYLIVALGSVRTYIFWKIAVSHVVMSNPDETWILSCRERKYEITHGPFETQDETGYYTHVYSLKSVWEIHQLSYSNSPLGPITPKWPTLLFSPMT